MQIKEIESLSGMDRATIRFYEREGLLMPKHLDDGYRDYSNEDLQVLLRIKLLRSLQLSIDEIKALRNGSKGLSETLKEHMEQLEAQDASYEQAVCRAIQEEKATFSNLNAAQYLEGIKEEETKSNTLYFAADDQLPPQVFYPWRRFFARFVDLFIYRLLWTGILGLLFHVNLSTRTGRGQLLDSFIAMIIMLFLEPIWLHLFGTTLGKAIFGLRIESDKSRRLTYQEGLARTWDLIRNGMGFNIPFYNIVCLWRNYKFCKEREVLSWDEYTAYTMKDTKWVRSALFVGVYTALFFVSFTIHSAQLLPPNRGDLTIAEFVENFNYYARYTGNDFGSHYLHENGKWMEKEFDGTAYVTLGYIEYPKFVFELENGAIKNVSFEIEVKNNREMIGAYNTEMTLASFAYIGAQKDVGLFSNALRHIAEFIENNRYENFRFTEGGVEVTGEYEIKGYGIHLQNLTTVWLNPDENEKENYYRLKFYMTK